MFLLGAGASFGSDEETVVPPLGAQLFDALRKHSRVWADIPDEAAEIFRNPERPFELGFAALAAQNDAALPQLLREMALYFLQFRPGPENAYRTFARKIPNGACVATLNYDLMFDIVAHELLGMPYERTKILKLHGAPNILPHRSFKFINDGSSHYETLYKGPVEVLSPGDAIAGNASGERLCPCMALYAPGKRVILAPSVAEEAQKVFADIVFRSDFVVVVGVSYVEDDNHIWVASRKLTHA